MLFRSQGFVIAITTAEKVEADVAFANRIADLQRKLYRESGLEAAPLPKLPSATYAGWVSTISSRGLAEAQTQFDAIIADVRKLYDHGIPALLAEGEAVDQAHKSLIDDFLETAWAQLREEITPQVDPAHTEESVASTERMLVELARQTVHGRLKTASGAPAAASS